MDAVKIRIEVKAGMATVAEVEAPDGVAVEIIIRDSDTDGSDPDDLDADEKGTLCFESVMEYPDRAEAPGFT